MCKNHDEILFTKFHISKVAGAFLWPLQILFTFLNSLAKLMHKKNLWRFYAVYKWLKIKALYNNISCDKLER